MKFYFSPTRQYFIHMTTIGSKLEYSTEKTQHPDNSHSVCVQQAYFKVSFLGAILIYHIVWGFFRPTREFFTNMETSPGSYN